MENFTTRHVLILLLVAVLAIFLAWLIVQIAYRKTNKDMRKHRFDEK